MPTHRTIDKIRVKREINALRQINPRISYDLNQGIVALEAWLFPAGWNPDTGVVLFDLPNNYPQSQPDVYIPSDMRFKGRRPMIMLLADKPGWSKHCIHNLRGRWDPNYHGMVTMLRMVKESFRRPNQSNPWGGKGYS